MIEDGALPLQELNLELTKFCLQQTGIQVNSCKIILDFFIRQDNADVLIVHEFFELKKDCKMNIIL